VNDPLEMKEARRSDADLQGGTPGDALDVVERLGARAPHYLAVILENLGAGALLIEGDERRLVLANRTLGEFVGLTVPQLLAMTREAFIEHVGTLADTPDEIRDTLGGIPKHGPYTATSRISIVRPRRRILQWEARPVLLPAGVGQLCIYRDVTVEVDATEALQGLADTDALTGLANRRRGLEAIKREFARVERHPGPVCVALFDIDHFKRINDMLGHAAGDEVLRQVASALLHGSRRNDVAIRWGGEELVVLLADCSLEGARVLAERFRAAVEALPAPGGRPVSVSGGVAQYRSPETAERLIERADELMYRAKAMGRNRILVDANE